MPSPSKEYLCLHCDERGMTKEDFLCCEKCGREMKRVWSFGISFKGSGFYRNDHKD